MSYDMIDRFLRNNLDDDNYAEYSAALDELCTPPAQRTPLTDEQVRNIAKQYALSLAFPYEGKTTPEMFARAIEAAHGITGEKK